MQDRQFEVERSNRGRGSSRRPCPLLGHKSFSLFVLGYHRLGPQGRSQHSRR